MKKYMNKLLYKDMAGHAGKMGLGNIDDYQRIGLTLVTFHTDKGNFIIDLNGGEIKSLGGDG